MAARSNWLLSLTALAARWLPAGLKRRLYRAGPLAGFLRRMLNRAAPHGLSQVVIAGGELAGLRFSLDLQSEKDYWLGTYEPDLQAAVGELLQPGWTAYDVGANVGYISLLLARKLGPQGQVIAFEALPENVERLQANLALNSGLARVVAYHRAVIDTTRPVSFLLGPSDDTGKAAGSAGRQGLEYSRAIEVPGLALDDFVYQQGGPLPQVIKLDIEGGEVLALPGMQRLLAEARPLLLVELHGEQAAHSAWEILTRAGYRICRMRAGYPRVPSLEALDWKAYLVAFPPESQALG